MAVMRPTHFQHVRGCATSHYIIITHYCITTRTKAIRKWGGPIIWVFQAGLHSWCEGAESLQENSEKGISEINEQDSVDSGANVKEEAWKIRCRAVGLDKVKEQFQGL